MKPNPKGHTMTTETALIRRSFAVDHGMLDAFSDTARAAANVVSHVELAVRPFREASGLTRRALAETLNDLDLLTSLTESVLATVEAGTRRLSLDEAILLLQWMRAAPVTTGRYTGTESNHSNPESETHDDRF